MSRQLNLVTEKRELDGERLTQLRTEIVICLSNFEIKYKLNTCMHEWIFLRMCDKEYVLHIM